MRRRFMLKISICIVVIIFIFAMAFSINKFGVINPISSCFGMIKILITDAEYTVVQQYPNRVVFANPDTASESLDKYMQERGFREVEELRTGSELVYVNGNKMEKVDISVNGYYSMWRWKE